MSHSYIKCFCRWDEKLLPSYKVSFLLGNSRKQDVKGPTCRIQGQKRNKIFHYCISTYLRLRYFWFFLTQNEAFIFTKEAGPLPWSRQCFYSGPQWTNQTLALLRGLYIFQHLVQGLFSWLESANLPLNSTKILNTGPVNEFSVYLGKSLIFDAFCGAGR